MESKAKNKIISVFGTSGAGKSYIANKYFFEKPMDFLLDLDTQNSVSAIMNEANKENNIMNLDYNNISKLNLISSNIEIDDYENNIKIDIERILEKIEGNIIIDLPNCIYLDEVYESIKRSDNIYFIINPNFLSIRQSIKYLNVIKNIWNIDDSYVKIIVNKITLNSLSKNIIKDIYSRYEVIDYIKYNRNIEKMINLQMFNFRSKYAKKNI